MADRYVVYRHIRYGAPIELERFVSEIQAAHFTNNDSDRFCIDMETQTGIAPCSSAYGDGRPK